MDLTAIAELLSVTTLCLGRTIEQKCKKKQNIFKFHITLHILSVITDSFRVETEQEVQKKRTKIWVWRASWGKVQVCHSSCASQYKNATTQLVQLSCQQDRFRAGRAPC